MNYNIHPIFVHFPIALLTIYSVVRALPLERWLPKIAWRDIGRALLVFGVLGAFASLSTGEIAEHLTKPNRQLVESHSTFAAIATWIYVALLVGEIAGYVKAKTLFFERLPRVIREVSTLADTYLRNGVLPIILAILGLVTISVAGLLGGVLVYGTTADPLAGYVLSILGITI